MELSGARVLVTGASSGIGAAVARDLAKAGATVGLVARRAELLDEVLADVHAAGSTDSRRWAVDLSDLAAAEKVALEAWQSFGHLDALVNNAGIPLRKHAARLSFEEVERTMRVNYLSPVRMTLAVLPKMLERGAGVIVNVASMAGRVGPPREAAYAGSKFALTGFSEVLAVDLDGSGVEIRVVQPGPIDTPIWGDVPGNEQPVFDGEKFPPEDCSRVILEALTQPGFERFMPADLKGIVEFKAKDIDTFLAGNAAFAKGQSGPSAARETVPDWAR